MNRYLAGFLLGTCLLAGCSDASDDPLLGGSTSTQGANPTNGTITVPPPPAAVEIHNRTYTLQPLASPSADSMTVPLGHNILNVTAEVIATAACFYTNTEPRTEHIDPGVYLTSPSGNQSFLSFDTPSSCDPLGTFPRRLDLTVLTLAPESGTWSVQVLATGQNADVRLIVRVGSPPAPYV